MVKKKAQSLANFKNTIQKGKDESILEVDEVFSYVYRKVNQIRIWIVLCKQTRQIVSFFIGDGSMESCKRLWRKLPSEYLKCNSFSDFWKSYNCIPDSTHQKVGKETGLTNHIERLNNTIRQRFSRLVRKTLSFSKKEYMLNLHFKLWAYYYNLEIKNQL
jgi:insertion element IS1 protein InsB